MTGTAPVWLAEEPEILALLGAALDRFDRQPGDARQRMVLLPAEKHLRSLARMDEQADQLWRLVCRLAADGVLEIRSARRGPYDPDWKGAKLAFPPQCENVLREWLDRERNEPAMQAWRRAVLEHAHAFPGGCEALLKRRIVIPGRSPQEVVAALARLAHVRQACTLRQLSALAFWGDSKVLDERGDLIATLFPQLDVRERALVVAVYLPESCKGVLFIENQDTYTAGVAGSPIALKDLALVYAAGFRGAAARIRTRSGAVLHYSGPGASALAKQFESWWYDDAPPPGPLWFWGDLDFAGMQILKSLRSRFTDLAAWRPGYEPMLAALRERGGYNTGGDEESAQMDPGTTGCEFADSTLLPAIRQYGRLDQELLALIEAGNEAG